MTFGQCYNFFWCNYVAIGITSVKIIGKYAASDKLQVQKFYNNGPFWLQNEAYGQEAGFKTILQLAIEEDDGAPYVEELLKVNTFFVKLVFSWEWSCWHFKVQL